MEYYIWLQLCLGQGNRYVNRIFDSFYNAKAVFDADATTRAKLLPKSVAEKLVDKVLGY